MALRQFVSVCPPGLQRARVFQYGGSDLLGTIDLPASAVSERVAASLRDGFSVDWVYRNALLYLRVFESDRPPPSWERVFAQQDLADVRTILGESDSGTPEG